MPEQKTHPRPQPIGQLTQLLLESLASLGGVASAHHLAPTLDLPPGEIRRTLRACSARVRYLGAGYFALHDQPAPPLLDFAERWLGARPGRQGETEGLVQAILREYPHGDAEAVRRWLRQEPGALQHDVRGGVIRLLPQRWKHPR